MNSPKRMLVTGATGFIGSHVAREISWRGHDVVALHRTEKPKGADWTWQTIEELEKSGGRFDAIIHAAAIRHRHGIPAGDYLIQNTALTGRLLDFAKSSGSGRFVLVSSIAVFGWPKKLPISDENPYAPVGPYGESKVQCEKKVRESGHPYAIVRPSITYGPGDTNGMIDKLFRLMKAGTFRLVGSGHSRVQLVYIDDLAWAIAESALRQELDGAEFLCTYENPISMLGLCALCAKTLGQRPPWPNVPIFFARLAASGFEFLESLGVLRGEPLVTHEKIDMVTVDRAYEISRMRGLLAWAPPTGYVGGIEKTCTALGWSK